MQINVNATLSNGPANASALVGRGMAGTRNRTQNSTQNSITEQSVHLTISNEAKNAQVKSLMDAQSESASARPTQEELDARYEELQNLTPKSPEDSGFTQEQINQVIEDARKIWEERMAELDSNVSTTSNSSFFQDLGVSQDAMPLFNILHNSNVGNLDGALAAAEMATLLTDAINASLSMPDATAEERAMQREAALRMANDFSQNYLSEQDALDFLSEVNRQLELDLQRERGYVDDGTRRPHAGSGINAGNPDFLTWVQGVASEEHKDLLERAANWDPLNPDDVRESVTARLRLIEIYGPQLSRLQESGEINNWLNKMDAAFEENVATVNNSRDTVRENFDSLIQEDMYSFINDWQNNMLELFNKLNKE